MEDLLLCIWLLDSLQLLYFMVTCSFTNIPPLSRKHALQRAEEKQAVKSQTFLMSCLIRADNTRGTVYDTAVVSALSHTWNSPRSAPAAPSAGRASSCAPDWPGSAAAWSRCKGSSTQTGKHRPLGRSRRQRTWRSYVGGLGSGSSTHF